MQSLEEKTAYNKVVVRTCYLTDFIYLSLHIFYMFVFVFSKTYIMLGFNTASIIAYLVYLILLKKEKYYAYAVGCGFEFLIFMSAGTILCGFSAGFQLCIIGLCVVSFYTAYFSKKRVIKKAILWTIQSTILYLVLHFYCSFNKPYYELNSALSITLYAIHSVAVFLFIGAYLLIFVKYAKKLEDRIINESRIDNLTQIHNRYDLYNYLDSITDKKDYALAIFDIDDFKMANDKYGHVCGDYILKEIARISKDTLSDSFVSRYGGEEFIVICKMYSDYGETVKKLDNLRDIIDKYEFEFNNQKLHVTITVGIEEYQEGIRVEEWISLADEKLYKGKNSGKNVTID